MAPYNPRIEACHRRKAYQRQWQVELFKTCYRRPGYFCFSMWCANCASYSLRKQALHGDMSRYICCNGICPCSGRMGEKDCPEFCLCLESFFCFAQSVATTRWMVQDEMQVETTECDNCIIGTMIFFQYLSCICHILACFVSELHDVAQFVDCLADFTWCTVCACMQTQAKAELDYRDANPGAVPPPLPGVVMQPPGVQMIPMGAQPPPPPPGAYPQQPYAQQQPYAGYPTTYPPQPGAYPPPPPPQGYGGYPQPMPYYQPGPPPSAPGMQR
ncbi:hypothetical protein Agub_g6993 [Astrephomene gubernaculifera]|uniref:PLAC8 family protein n=1 Tax=Astrephomene gubernaculifera TaxID=47775 RepID=A0AAD3DS35_9CHLO|nr:hypothetical protein Agub_g6993 [Astrephomene gubernaculifera]